MQPIKKLCEIFASLRKKREVAPAKSMLDTLAEKPEYFVYDGRKNFWGHAFEISEQIADQKLGENMACTYKISGIRDIGRAQDGDRVVFKMEDGKDSLFLLTNVRYVRDPSDMFFAQAVQMADDYQGGFGWNGQNKTEPPNRVKPAVAKPQTLG